eukprot:jgi/Botrbrau1/19135/Bobra.0077s0047.1
MQAGPRPLGLPTVPQWAPILPGTSQAVRTADVFVFVHGSAGANLVYMRDNTAVVEVNPRGLRGTTEGYWARVFYPDLTRNMGHRVWHFSLNIEDPELSWPAKWEEQGVGDTSLWPRDRHVRVPWEALRSVLQRIADLKGNKTAYDELEKKGENLLDLLPGGTVQRAPQAIERYGGARVAEVQKKVQEALLEAEAVQHWKKLGKAGGVTDAARRAKNAWNAVNRAVDCIKDAQTVLQEAAKLGRYVNETVQATVDEHVAIADRLKRDVAGMMPDFIE